jgi:multidrug efflux pump subunit AcrA (membrane-fusion protein)
MNTNAELLKELRIDRKAAPPPSRRGLWIALGIVVALLLVAGAAWAIFGRDRGIEVRTATVQAIGSGGASASVLDATGYVVARRMATVSAKITGKVREVLIEEGQTVEEGEVMATLDPVDADADRALAASQLAAARSQIGGVQAQLHEAELDANRLQTLVGQQLVS